MFSFALSHWLLVKKDCVNFPDMSSIFCLKSFALSCRLKIEAVNIITGLIPSDAEISSTIFLSKWDMKGAVCLKTSGQFTCCISCPNQKSEASKFVVASTWLIWTSIVFWGREFAPEKSYLQSYIHSMFWNWKFLQHWITMTFISCTSFLPWTSIWPKYLIARYCKSSTNLKGSPKPWNVTKVGKNRFHSNFELKLVIIWVVAFQNSVSKTFTLNVLYCIGLIGSSFPCAFKFIGVVS